ncbi:MAG TPA: hypothetical protein VGN88_08145 [Phycisphaerae bacterium]
MRKLLTVAILAVAFAGTAFADSIDDAEAKRRGVPVLVLQLEKQLASEKKKTADLEKEISDIEKKIAEMNSPKPAGAEAKTTSTAATKLDPQLPKPADGARKSSPIYDDFMARYMSGDWTKLAADIAGKGPQLAGLPAGNAADIAYVRAAVAECKPAWWEKIKAGKPLSIEATVFNRILPVSYTPGQLKANGATRSGKVIVLASWPAEQMDTLDAIDAKEALILSANNCTLGDFMDFRVWNSISFYAPLVEYGEIKLAELDKDEEYNVENASDLFATASGIYYGTPTGRYLGLLECCGAFSAKQRATILLRGRRQYAAFLLVELMSHPDKYPSLKLVVSGLPATLPKGTSPEQYLMDTFVSSAIHANKLTFSEDCALRQATWEFVMANTDWVAHGIKLPNGMMLENDLIKDQEAMNGRWEWFRHLTEEKSKDQPPLEPAATPKQ